ncbi:hypothetical protein HDU98_002437, partial [Podochytrium sp. JEL0797]
FTATTASIAIPPQPTSEALPKPTTTTPSIPSISPSTTPEPSTIPPAPVTTPETPSNNNECTQVGDLVCTGSDELRGFKQCAKVVNGVGSWSFKACPVNAACYTTIKSDVGSGVLGSILCGPVMAAR